MQIKNILNVEDYLSLRLRYLFFNSNLIAPSIIASQTIVFDSSDNTGGCTLQRLSNGIVIWSISSWTKYSILKQLVGFTLPEKFRPSIGIIKFFPFFQSDWLDYGFAYISIDSSGKITALTKISKNDTVVLDDNSLFGYTFEYVGK